MSNTYTIVPFQKSMGRAVFDCGEAALNSYFAHQVSQDIRRRVTSCFVALSSDNAVIGYYTLASASIHLSDLPEEVASKLPRYPSVPAVRLGRLAVSKNHQKKGLGGALLADAIMRVLQSPIAAFSLIVNAKDKQAVNFYQHFGFFPFNDNPQMLFLPMSIGLKALQLSR